MKPARVLRALHPVLAAFLLLAQPAYAAPCSAHAGSTWTALGWMWVVALFVACSRFLRRA